jgi:hypothetical protein
MSIIFASIFYFGLGSIRRLWIGGKGCKFIYISYRLNLLCHIMETIGLTKEEIQNLRSGMDKELTDLIKLLGKADGSLYELEKILEPGFKETKRILLERTANLHAKACSKKKNVNHAIKK